MLDLTQTVFNIPIMIDTNDRYRNLIILLEYFNNNIKTNINIYTTSELNLKQYDNLNINIIYKTDNIFHRTKYLNELLNISTEKVVVNYDVDVLLPIDLYYKAQQLILEDKTDIVYPFGDNNNQIRLYNAKITDTYLKNPTLNTLHYDFKDNMYSNAGFCIFFKNNVYKEGGGENENFISYGHEDKERLYRFKTLGYRITRFDNDIYHMEHIRTSDSNSSNPYFLHNTEEYNKVCNMNRDEILEYLNKQSYLKKYNFGNIEK